MCLIVSIGNGHAIQSDSDASTAPIGKFVAAFDQTHQYSPAAITAVVSQIPARESAIVALSHSLIDVAR